MVSIIVIYITTSLVISTIKVFCLGFMDQGFVCSLGSRVWGLTPQDPFSQLLGSIGYPPNARDASVFEKVP